MNETIFFTLTNKILLCQVVCDTVLQLLEMAIDIDNTKLNYFYWLIIFNLFMLVLNYKFIIQNSVSQGKRDYIYCLLYLIEILGQTYFNLATSVNISAGRIFFGGTQRVLFLILGELNIHNVKIRRFFLIVENIVNFIILYMIFYYFNRNRLEIPLIENFLISLWIVVFDYYYQKKRKELEEKEFYEQKQKEIQAEIIKPSCEVEEEVDEIKISQSMKRIYEFDDSPSIHIIQQPLNNQLSSFYQSEKSHLRSKSISANISQKQNEEQFLSYKSRSIKNSFKNALQQHNSSNLVPPSNSDISSYNYFQKVYQSHTQQGICCFNQNFELIYHNTQLSAILGIDGKNQIQKKEDRLTIKEEIWKIPTVMVCDDPAFNNALLQHQTSDFQDFQQIIKLFKKKSQENTQTSGSNQQNTEILNPYGFIREKIYEYKKSQFKPNARFPNSSQDQVGLDLNASAIKLFPGGYHTFYRFSDDKEKRQSSAFFSNSFVFSLTQRTLKEFPYQARNIYFQQANITLIHILECLYILLDIKHQIWDEFNQLHQSPHRNLKQLDFNLITTFTKDSKILEAKISHICQGSQNLLSFEINDISENYLLRLTKLQSEVMVWQKNHNSSCIKSFINGIIPLVEIGLNQKSGKIYLQKINSFYNTYCLNLSEGEFLNFMPKKYGSTTTQQFEMIYLCEDLRNDIVNILRLIDIKLEVKQCDTPVICSDPNKIRIILWNIIYPEIMYKLFAYPAITITIYQQDIQIFMKIDGKGILQDQQLFDFLNKSTDTSHSQQVSRTITGTLKETRFTQIVQRCQSIALELSLYQQDLQVSNLLENDKTQGHVEIRFTITNQNPDLSEIPFTFNSFNQYKVSGKFQIVPKFDHKQQIQFSERKLMIYDSNGYERFSLEQQLNFLIIKHKFVFTSNNIKEEINKEILNTGFNPYSVIMIIIDPFDEFNYKDLNFELKEDFQVNTLALSCRKMEKAECEKLGFDDSLEKPLLLEDLYRIWSQYIELQDGECIQNPQ